MKVAELMFICSPVCSGLDVHRPNLLLGVMIIHKAKGDKKLVVKPVEIPTAIKVKVVEEEPKPKTSGTFRLRMRLNLENE